MTVLEKATGEYPGIPQEEWHTGNTTETNLYLYSHDYRNTDDIGLGRR